MKLEYRKVTHLCPLAVKQHSSICYNIAVRILRTTQPEDDFIKDQHLAQYLVPVFRKCLLVDQMAKIRMNSY